MNRFKSFLRFRISLTFKFIFAMFFLVLLTSAAFGWFIIAREIAYEQSQMETYGKLLVKSLANLIQYTTDLSDRAALQLMLERIIEDENIAQCTVTDQQGKMLAHTSKPTPNRYPAYLLSHPVLSKEGQKTATLEIGLSLKKGSDRMVALRRDILLVTLGLVGVGVLFTLIFTRLLLSPIEKLVSATERVARGELAPRVDIRSRDEIGDLAKAFNQMTLQIKESRDELEEKVEERTRQLEENIVELNRARTSTLKTLRDLELAKRELEKTNLELKELDETRMKFIGIASHELKTPLTAIKSNVDFILSEREGKLPEHLKSYLLTIQRNTNRIQTRMDHMLDLARIKLGRLHLQPERINLSEVVPCMSMRSNRWTKSFPSRSRYRMIFSSPRTRTDSMTSLSTFSQTPSSTRWREDGSRSWPVRKRTAPFSKFRTPGSVSLRINSRRSLKNFTRWKGENRGEQVSV